MIKNELTYTKAFEKLEELVEQLEQGDIQLDKLTEKVEQANELIGICESKLRDVEAEINEATKTVLGKAKKKDSNGII